MSIQFSEIKLVNSTPNIWLDLAAQRIPELLSDHACCEKKAASMALTMMKHFHAHPRVLCKLSKIAREELVHYEQVLGLHVRLGITFQPKPASQYAKKLWLHVDKSGPYALIDQLMICAIIEARSCERFDKLSPKLPEPLSSYYHKLYQAEKRHAEVYLDFAAVFADDPLIQKRLDRLLSIENELITMTDPVFRFHSGIPSQDLISSTSKTIQPIQLVQV